MGTTDDTKIDSVSKNVIYQSFRSGICKSRKDYVRKLQFSSTNNLKMPFFVYILAFGIRSGVPRMTLLLSFDQVFKNIKVFYSKPISL